MGSQLVAIYATGSSVKAPGCRSLVIAVTGRIVLLLFFVSLQFTPYFCNNLQRLEDSVFSPDKRNHGRWSARVCARMRNRSEKGLNALALRRRIDLA